MSAFTPKKSREGSSVHAAKIPWHAKACKRAWDIEVALNKPLSNHVWSFGEQADILDEAIYKAFVGFQGNFPPNNGPGRIWSLDVFGALLTHSSPATSWPFLGSAWRACETGRGQLPFRCPFRVPGFAWSAPWWAGHLRPWPAAMAESHSRSVVECMECPFVDWWGIMLHDKYPVVI